MSNAKEKELSEVAVQVMLPPSVKSKLRELAEKNGRSLSGECRYALSQYVARRR